MREPRSQETSPIHPSHVRIVWHPERPVVAFRLLEDIYDPCIVLDLERPSEGEVYAGFHIHWWGGSLSRTPAYPSDETGDKELVLTMRELAPETW